MATPLPRIPKSSVIELDIDRLEITVEGSEPIVFKKDDLVSAAFHRAPPNVVLRFQDGTQRVLEINNHFTQQFLLESLVQSANKKTFFTIQSPPN